MDNWRRRLASFGQRMPSFKSMYSKQSTLSSQEKRSAVAPLLTSMQLCASHLYPTDIYTRARPPCNVMKCKSSSKVSLSSLLHPKQPVASTRPFKAASEKVSHTGGCSRGTHQGVAGRADSHLQGEEPAG